MPCDLQADTSLSCTLECPNLRQRPRLAPCTQNASLSECACEDEHHYNPCTTNDLHSQPCVWAAGGGGGGVGVEILVNLPRDVTPSLTDIPMIATGVRRCATQHMPLQWVDVQGKPVVDSSLWWVVSDAPSTTQIMLMEPNLSTGAGHVDWSTAVKADPEAALQKFGACVHSLVQRQTDAWSKAQLSQLSGLVAA